MKMGPTEEFRAEEQNRFNSSFSPSVSPVAFSSINSGVRNGGNKLVGIGEQEKKNHVNILGRVSFPLTCLNMDTQGKLGENCFLAKSLRCLTRLGRNWGFSPAAWSGWAVKSDVINTPFSLSVYLFSLRSHGVVGTLLSCVDFSVWICVWLWAVAVGGGMQRPGFLLCPLGQEGAPGWG